MVFSNGITLFFHRKALTHFCDRNMIDFVDAGRSPSTGVGSQQGDFKMIDELDELFEGNGITSPEVEVSAPQKRAELLPGDDVANAPSCVDHDTHGGLLLEIREADHASA